MTELARHITVAKRYARSTNLERDLGAGDALDGYLLTGRAIEMVDRITAAAVSGTGGAWSVTGPYGSGKSSLGVLLDALFGESSTNQYATARQLLDETNPDLAKTMDKARRDLGPSGYIRALVTANAEPVTHTITRALHTATIQHFGKSPSARAFPAVKLLKAALDDMTSDDPSRTGPSPASLLEVAIALATQAPLLIVIDEFGKNLEAAQQRSDADLYLLQLLAEAAQTERGAPIFLVTMQHLAFGDYAAAADTAQQREWAKIQGRFEDIVFVDAAAQTRQLITTVFNPDATLGQQVDEWAAAASSAMAEVQLFEVADPALVAACYPLHPTVLAVLPELCRRYGQNERTLFGFLTSNDTFAVPHRLTQLEVTPDGPLPTIGLADVYDYFAATSTSATTRTSRWAEIIVRLRDVAGLPEAELAAAKTIAVLNLIATSGPLRASPPLLATVIDNANKVLNKLVADNIAVHRETVDEYRIWQGSDVDLERLVDTARRDATHLDALNLLSSVAPLEPVIAAGHSMRTDTLRTFHRSYLTQSDDFEVLPPSTNHDGRYYLSLDPAFIVPSISPGGYPVVVHVPDDIDALLTAAREVHAYTTALDDTLVKGDWVARTELRERQADAGRHLDAALRNTIEAGTSTLVTDTGATVLSRQGTAALSEAADIAYTHSVPIRNETLNRVDISSQGAKARRQLIQAMLGDEHRERLGLDGYGPDVAMYRSVLEESGIHAYDARHERWQMRPPKNDAFKTAWAAIDKQLRAATDRRINLNDIYATLQLPPIGMKPGPIPVFVTAALIATSDEVALYEHGTFRPSLTDEISDRLVRNPGHFEIKHFANSTGARRDVVEALAVMLELEPRFRKQRVANVLAVVGALVSRISKLAPETLNATDLTDTAIAVRDAVATAVEPDELLFSALPSAVGLSPIGARTSDWQHERRFTDRLARALEELEGHYTKTLDGLLDELYSRSREPGRPKLTQQAKVLEDEVLDPDLRAFVLAVASDAFEDHRWIENIAAVVTRSAPRHWSPNDRKRFSTELAGKLGAFRRLLILHSELRGLQAGSFEAHRITLTSSTGDEDAILVALDDNDRTRISNRAEQLIAELAEHYQSSEEAERATLAWFADRVLGSTVTPISQDDVSTPLKAANND